MMVVDSDLCPQDHPCPSVKLCPTGALSQEGIGLPTIDAGKCTECGQCVAFCPKRAIKFEL